MRIKLTNRSVGALKPRPRHYEVADSELPGFSVRMAPSGTLTYYVRYTLASGQRRRLKLGIGQALTPAQARAQAMERLGQAAGGGDPAAERKRERRQSFEEFVKNEYGPWLHTHRKSAAKVQQVLTNAFPGLQKKKLDEISAFQIEKWRRTMRKEGRSSVTTNRYIAYLKAMLTRAVEWGFITEHPLKAVKLDREDNLRVRYLDPDEERRLMQEIDAREERMRKERDNYNEWLRDRGMSELPDLRDRPFADYLKPMVTLSLNTGLRRGELFNLEWSDIKLQGANPQLTVRAEVAKSGKTRHIPLNRQARDTLVAWHGQSPTTGLVFPSPQTGKVFDNCYTAWGEVIEKAKIRDFHWHDMRHHFASQLVMRGASLYTVKEILGHSTITMTERYAHLAPEHKAKAVALLDQHTDNVAEFPGERAATGE